MTRDRIMERRALTATFCVAAMLVAIPCIDALTIPASGIQPAQEEPAGLSIAALQETSDPMKVLDRLEADIEAHDEIPNALKSEAFIPEKCRSLRMSADGAVMSYVMDSPLEDASAFVQSGMEALGWSAIPLGNGSGATYVKRRGTYTWALVTCTQVANSTVVVVRSFAS